MKPHPLIASLVIGLSALSHAGGAAAAPIVLSTLPSWDGNESIGDFGAAGFSAWGQFFRAPTGVNRMLDFTFVLSDALQGSGTTPVPVTFQAYLVPYDIAGRRITGPALYTSAPVTVPLTDGLQFVPYTFDMDVEVAAASGYLMFMFANNYDVRIPLDSRLRIATAGESLPVGAYNTVRDADASLDTVLAAQWFSLAGPDLAFSATFDNRPTDVPEPGTLALLAGAGLAGGWMRRRRA